MDPNKPKLKSRIELENKLFLSIPKSSYASKPGGLLFKGGGKKKVKVAKLRNVAQIQNVPHGV